MGKKREVKEEKIEKVDKKEKVKEEKKETKKEEKVEVKPKNKKIMILLAVLCGVILLCGVVGLTLSSGKNIFTGEPKVKITKNEASMIEYEDYDNGLVSLKIPKGWKVDVAPVDYIHYSFKVYNSSNPTYMLLFNMKLEGFNKSEASRNWQKTYYPTVMFAKTPVINPQTTEGFFKVWNETAEYVNSTDVKSEFLPKLNEFKIVENLGKNPIGGDILRATYTDSNGKLAQGLFTASVKDVGSYYVNSNMFNLFSDKIDVWPLNVYNTILMTAPDEEFNNWQSILDNCLASMEFSDTFIKEFNKEESNIMSTIQANQKVYNEMSDMIMDSWEKRNNSYDIISQKQSDATLGYERVYDTDTGEIYKAQNGFMDHYDGTKYQAITEDMYTMPTSGYIE